MSSVLTNLTRIFNKNRIGQLFHITGAIDDSLSKVSHDLTLLDLELVLTSSTGEWLDEWGSWFGVYRLLGESDENYRNRIISMCTKPKNTIPAIEDAIKSYVGDPNLHVYIHETYKDIFKVSDSPISDGSVFQDGDYYRPGVIDISIQEDITPELIKIIEQIKGAGIIVFFTHKYPLKIDNTVDLGDPIVGHKTLYDISMDNPNKSFILSNPDTFSYPLSGERYLWDNLNRFIDMSSARYHIEDPVHPVDNGKVMVYPFILGGCGQISESYPLSGHVLSPYDIQNPTPYIDYCILPKADFCRQGEFMATNYTVRISDLPLVKETEMQVSDSYHSKDSDIEEVTAYRTIYVAWEGDNRYQYIEDVEEMTVEELSRVEDMSQYSTEITLIS